MLVLQPQGVLLRNPTVSCVIGFIEVHSRTGTKLLHYNVAKYIATCWYS